MQGVNESDMSNDYQSLRRYAYTFKFARRGYRLGSETAEMCKRILHRYVQIHRTLRRYKPQYDHGADEHTNTMRTRVAEHIMDKLLDFYRTLECVIREFVCILFMQPDMYRMAYMWHVFEQLNGMLRICYYFDQDRRSHEALFHDFSWRKRMHSIVRQYTREYIFQTSLFCACSMPMATLFMSQFISRKDYVRNDFRHAKRAMLVSKARKRLMYLICCILGRNERLKYCFLFFSGTYCSLYRSEYVEYLAEGMDRRLYEYFIDMQHTQ